MRRYIQPKSPRPTPVRGSDTASFACYTMRERLPKLTTRIIEETPWPTETKMRLATLVKDLPNGTVRHLTDTTAPDALNWQHYLTPWLGQTWLEIPWYIAEAYFYRRVLEATGYFEAGEGYNIDPYAQQKTRSLDAAGNIIRLLSKQLNEWLKAPTEVPQRLVEMLIIDLWGNRADLSMWPLDETPDGIENTIQQEEETRLLVNHAQKTADYLLSLKAEIPRVDFITDNVGFELACDLLLADFLISTKLVTTVCLNLKSHPSFISDATISDVKQMINAFVTDSDAELALVGKRLQSSVDNDHLQLKDDYFWTSPLVFWEMPKHLLKTFSQSKLVISKGDANYRRFLGDLHWVATTPIEDIIDYFPAPLVLLRTFKSEVAAGLQPDQVKQLTQKEHSWMTNGDCGVIQFIKSQNNILS